MLLLKKQPQSAFTNHIMMNASDYLLTGLSYDPGVSVDTEYRKLSYEYEMECSRKREHEELEEQKRKDLTDFAVSIALLGSI